MREESKELRDRPQCGEILYEGKLVVSAWRNSLVLVAERLKAPMGSAFSVPSLRLIPGCALGEGYTFMRQQKHN